jgi:DNA-binding response OmpR family regulator
VRTNGVKKQQFAVANTTQKHVKKPEKKLTQIDKERIIALVGVGYCARAGI